GRSRAPPSPPDTSLFASNLSPRERWCPTPPQTSIASPRTSCSRAPAPPPQSSRPAAPAARSSGSSADRVRTYRYWRESRLRDACTVRRPLRRPEALAIDAGARSDLLECDRGSLNLASPI